MQKKFLGNLFFLIVLNLLVKPFWILGIDRAVQNNLGQEVYGEYFALLNFSFLLNIVLDFGITNFNNRNIAQNQQLFNKYLVKLLSMKFILGGLYVLLTFGAALLIGYDSRQWEILGILLLNQFLVSLVLFLRSNFSGLFYFKTDSIISVLDRLLLIVFCGVLLLYKDGDYLTVKSFVLAQSAAYGLVAIVALLILLRLKEKIKLKFRWAYSVVIFRQSLPFALLVLLMTIYTRTDSVMIERMLPNGKQSAGIYAQSYRILESLNMIAFLFSTLLLPIFSKLLKQKESVKEVVNSSSKLLALYSISAFVIISIYHKEILNLMYTDVNHQGEMVLMFLSFCIIPISGTYIYGTLLTANGSLRSLNKMAVFGVGLNVVLNFILIPKYEVMGAVVATVVTQLLTFLAQFFISKKLIGDWSYSITASVLVYLVVAYGLVMWLHSEFTIGISIAISLGAMLVLSLLLKLFVWQHFKELLRSRA